jgi:hypothetical protein
LLTAGQCPRPQERHCVTNYGGSVEFIEVFVISFKVLLQSARRSELKKWLTERRGSLRALL